MQDTLWYAPLDATPGIATPVVSAYGEGNELQAAQPFTVSLVSVYLASQHLSRVGWLDRVIQREHDVLIYSTTTRGAKAPVQRVHYHQTDFDLKQPLFKGDMLSDTIHVCEDYDGKEDLFVDLHVATPSTLRMKTDSSLHDFATMAGAAGGFPALAPYLSQVRLGISILEAVQHVLTARLDDHAERIHDTLRLSPPKTLDSKTLRYGRYIAFEAELDATGYSLEVNGRITGPDAERLSYAVFRIDDSVAPTPDFVISQRAATVLTGL
jgi:hypothetical protein